MKMHWCDHRSELVDIDVPVRCHACRALLAGNISPKSDVRDVIHESTRFRGPGVSAQRQATQAAMRKLRFDTGGYGHSD